MGQVSAEETTTAGADSDPAARSRQVNHEDVHVDGDVPVTPGDGGGGSGGSGDSTPAVDRSTLGLWLLLGAITMFFGGFMSVYLVRSGEMAVGPMPQILWLSTGALLASSLALEWARRGLGEDDAVALRRGLGTALALGLLFVAGQYDAWRELAAAGLYVGSSAHSSFFYLLSGAHGVHILGGLAVLAGATWRAYGADGVTEALGGSVERTALYWHFMDGLWLLLFVLLFWY